LALLASRLGAVVVTCVVLFTCQLWSLCVAILICKEIRCPREKKIEFQERIYNQHVRLSRALVGWHHQSLLRPGSRHCYGIIALKMAEAQGF
jgi:hypothetical protein